jgi:hypothetical protein
MSDEPSERFFSWFQRKAEDARASPIGHRLALDGDWRVQQTWDARLVWALPIPGGYAWLCDQDQGLGATTDEPFRWGICDETHDQSLDCGGGLAPTLDEALRCVGDPMEWEKALSRSLAEDGSETTPYGQHRIAAMKRLRRLKEHIPTALDESIRIAPEDLSLYLAAGSSDDTSDIAGESMRPRRRTKKD